MKSKLSKPITTSAAVALALCLTPLVQAQSTRTGDTTTNRPAQTERSSEYRQDRMAAGEHAKDKRAKDLVGKDVRSATGGDLGKLNDLVIDVQSGRILYGIVSSGGFLGIGDTQRAVPFQAFQRGTGERDELTLNIDSAKWENAPSFRQGEIASLSDENRAREIHEHYGQTWSGIQQQLSSAASAVGAAVRGEAAQRSGQQQLMLSSNIKGKNIRSGQQTVGEVEDVIITAQDQKAAALIDADNDFAGSDQKFVVQFNQLQASVGEDSDFTTTLSRQDFQNASTRMSGTTTAQTQTSSGASVYVWQDSDTRATLGTRAGRDAGYASGTDAQRGDRNQAAMQVEAVRQALRTDSGLGQAARQVNVMVEDNKLILRGTVASQQEKQQIERKAKDVAQGVNVDNEITVRSPAE